MNLLPWLVFGWLLLVGIYGMATSRQLLNAVICLSICQSSTYVLLLGVGFRRGGTAPVFDTVRPGSRPVVDPIVQALTLTDVVVSATVTALLLAMVIQVGKSVGSLDPDELATLEE